MITGIIIGILITLQVASHLYIMQLKKNPPKRQKAAPGGHKTPGKPGRPKKAAKQPPDPGNALPME